MRTYATFIKVACGLADSH